ncbi:MAG: ABC transporter ATP-binding protein [Candidatus Hodarchaeales archaeon]
MKNKKTTFRVWLIRHMVRNQFSITTLLIGTVLFIALRGLIPIIVGIAIDEAIIDRYDYLSVSKQLALLTQLLIILLIIGILRSLIGYIATFAQQRVAWRAQRRIREEFFDSMQNKPLKFHDATSTGEIMALATNDLGQVGEFFGFGFGMVTEVLISLVITAGLALGVLNSPALIIVSIPFLITYIWAIRFHNRRMAPISRTFMRKWAGIATAIQDNITGAEVVRAFGSTEYERKKFMDYVIDFRNTWEKQQIIQAQYFPTLVLYGAIGLTFVVSSILVLNGQLTIGGMIGFNGLLVVLLPPTYVVSYAIQVFNGGLAGAERIHKAMFSQEGEEDQNGKDDLDFPEDARGEIVFENVVFKYPTSKKPVLDDINLHIAPNQTVALVGPTGCGKSSLVRLLLRLYDYEGKITIDDTDIKDFSLESLRKGIGLIEQDIYLFPRSIQDNIAFGNRNASQEEIEKAAELAQIHNFIISTIDKYETNAGEGGSMLSGGQKQRVAIARTFLANPRILILDDSTSSVDSKTEEEIIKAIGQVTTNRTTFIITHRISLIRKADVVIVLKNGKIAAFGHHSQLIRYSPDYRRIFAKSVDLPPLEELSTLVKMTHAKGGV